MNIEVKFSESTSEIPVQFENLHIVTTGVPPEEVAKLVADAKKQGIEEGYATGYADGNVLYYASRLPNAFEDAVFPENYNAVLKIKSLATSVASHGLYRTFVSAQNLKSVKIITDDKETSVSFAQTFRECASIETIDLTECTRKPFDISYMLYNANKVKSILGALDLSKCTTSASLSFAFFAGALEDVEIVPNTIKADIRFNSAKLTQASIESIINGLTDLSGGTTATLTLNGVGAKLTEAQKAAITAKNWTLVY